MKRYFGLCLLLIAGALMNVVHAQDYIHIKNAAEKLRKEYLEGLQFNKKGDFDKSVKVFGKIIRQEPRFIDARIQLGAALEEIKLTEQAVTEYGQALKIDTLYEPRVLKAMGRLLKAQEKYAEAAHCYERYAALANVSQELKDAAAAEAKTNRFIAYSLSVKKEILLENLGANINTAANEYLPCLSVDGQTLIFTRIVAGNEDFYQSRLQQDNTWSHATPIAELNTGLNEGAQSISADGKTLVFVACDYPDSYGSCDLYISYFRNGAWTKASNMGKVVNSTAWDSQPSLSADGRALFFASNRPGGHGDSDIWVSFKNENDQWKKPVALAAPVNDSKKSESPFIHPDGRTLYFRSNRQPGMGGFDLFVSRLSDDGKWSDPVNLGAPINTMQDEGALIVSTDGTTAYYASDVKNNKDVVNFGRNDIYRFKLPVEFRPGKVTYLKATVVDDASSKPLSAKVQLQRLKTGTRLTELTVEDDGVFLVCIPAGEPYALNVSRPGYTFYSANFSLDTLTSLEPYKMEVRLQQISQDKKEKKNKPVVLNNIFFDTGSARLRSESEYELNKLLSMLQENASLKIQINGHTDDVGNEADNLRLSTDRAKAVYDFLIGRGIEAGRLAYKGFGETMPLTNNEDDTSRQKNRRTEFEIR